ncbi:FtsX-like permease family protein [Allofournierella sp.]|uniref:ABC transporter permease n=1 Tax=Allofournierella sp. TaxID=1940256 RepID=UPI003AEF81D8
MRKAVYARLAVTSVRKNKQFYLPYLLTCSLCVMLYYIIMAIANNGDIGFLDSTVGMVMGMAGGLSLIFAGFFLFYTSGFLNKRRQKEFGVYSILGMEKRHLGRMLVYEALYVAAVSFAGGILGGMLLGELVYMLLLKLMSLPVTAGYLAPSPRAAVETVAVYSVIFALILARNLWRMYRSKAVGMLQGGNVGEKEPRTRWGVALLGILTLGGGYGLALASDNAIWVLFVFFFAVLLVIIGTYCLFTSGSIALLKGLRRNKNYYYHPRHFTGVSGMMWRMKQNAMGLASICILSTAVLVTIATTVCLYAGMEDTLEGKLDHDYNLQVLSYNHQGAASTDTPAEDGGAAVEALMEQMTARYGARPENVHKAFMQRQDGRSAYVYEFDAPQLGRDEQRQLSDELFALLDTADGWEGWITTRPDSRQRFLELYGMLLFMGVFFGLIFLMATVLIIYYKQVSEGYEDKQRFDILQKVGMSKPEVRRTIRSQVVTVFFLPLLVAGIHLFVALRPMFGVMSGAFGMTNLPLFALVTGITLAVFAVIYVIVYLLTARTYYKIVA